MKAGDTLKLVSFHNYPDRLPCLIVENERGEAFAIDYTHILPIKNIKSMPIVYENGIPQNSDEV